MHFFRALRELDEFPFQISFLSSILLSVSTTNAC